VRTEDFNEGDPSYDKPVAAGIKVRPATDDDGKAKPIDPVTTETDEQVVMSTAEHASKTQEHNRAERGKMTVSSGDVEPQDGVPVRSLKTAAKSRTELTAESAGSKVRSAEAVQIDPGKGQTEEEMLEQMSEEDQEIYLEKKRALRSQYVDTDGQQPVAKVEADKVEEKEGMKLTQKVGGGTAVADPSGGKEGKPKEATRTEEGMTFKTTNVSERTKQAEPHPRAAEAQQPVMLKDGTADARLQIARSLCPDFPNSYSFTAPPKKKMARLQADFDDRPDVIRAVFAAESDAFKAQLMDEFPDAFKG
jgi:hypothetical protein